MSALTRPKTTDRGGGAGSARARRRGWTGRRCACGRAAARLDETLGVCAAGVVSGCVVAELSERVGSVRDLHGDQF